MIFEKPGSVVVLGRILVLGVAHHFQDPPLPPMADQESRHALLVLGSTKNGSCVRQEKQIPLLQFVVNDDLKTRGMAARHVQAVLAGHRSQRGVLLQGRRGKSESAIQTGSVIDGDAAVQRQYTAIG